MSRRSHRWRQPHPVSRPAGPRPPAIPPTLRPIGETAPATALPTTRDAERPSVGRDPLVDRPAVAEPAVDRAAGTIQSVAGLPAEPVVAARPPGPPVAAAPDAALAEVSTGPVPARSAIRAMPQEQGLLDATPDAGVRAVRRSETVSGGPAVAQVPTLPSPATGATLNERSEGRVDGGHVDGAEGRAAFVQPQDRSGLDGHPGCTAAQLRRFIKSRAYVPLHELRRRFDLNGAEDDVSGIDVDGRRLFVGLPVREAQLLGELLGAGDVGYELLLDPTSPLVVGVFPMRPVPRA